ncbi:MAG TPA: metal ABC transporter substrate-binding protein [Pedobacter sp.]
MKKPAGLLTAIMMVAILCIGCSSNKDADTGINNKDTATVDADTAGQGADVTQAAGEQENESEKLNVMVSFYPMYDFVSKVGGEKVSVTGMVPAGNEPHDWEPAASDIAALEEADMFIYNGAGMEHWVDTVLDSLGNKELVTVEASAGIELLGGHSEEGEEDSEEAYDPHVWLNPVNAKKVMLNIKDALVKADPGNAEYFTKNYETYAAEFDELDQKYKDALTGLEKKDIIVAHEAFGYLCKAYGLNQVGIEGLSPDSEPDPARMEEIIEFAKENNVKIIFFEELVSPKVAETIANEVGVETDVLNPLEGLSDEELNAGADYFSVMEENLQRLLNALR